MVAYGHSRQILTVGLTLKRPWRSSRFVSPCFVLPFHLARQNEKWCRQVLAKFTDELKTLLCVNTRATAPVRQSVLRSQTSPFTSVILMKSAQRCINRMKHEGDWHIFFFRACILSYVRVALEFTSETTQRLCARSFNVQRLGVGVSMQRWLTCLQTTHRCCSRLHMDVIDQ